jgi:predicted TIM-barrel fold metal-dependent hydrolase
MNMAVSGGLPLVELEGIAARLAELGWHHDLITDRVERMEEICNRLRALPVPLVIEQMGRVKGGQSLQSPGFLALLGLLREGNTWVKLSHAYHISSAGPPYADTITFARTLAEASIERLVWGSDWPHPMLHGPMPNDGMLVDLLAEWLPDLAQRRAVLIDNPARLYGFGPA